DEKASPKAIDFTEVTNGGRPGKPSVGIYKLDGDTLTIHRSGLGKPRSAVFENGSQAGLVATYTRTAAVPEGNATEPGITGGPARSGLQGGSGRPVPPAARPLPPRRRLPR
ncbi:MAG TPA: hypothetical protein VKW77_11240, partial [Acidimicrobiales bacterium]|nr:hypothetical protein [Acidimicrobiales bacterium]